MNILLHNLAEQCRTFHHNGHGGYDQSFDEEKFAELIVRECEKIAKDSSWYYDSPSCDWRNPINHVCKMMKKDFGIEE